MQNYHVTSPEDERGARQTATWSATVIAEPFPTRPHAGKDELAKGQSESQREFQSSFLKVEFVWDRLESVGHVAPAMSGEELVDAVADEATGP
jgi:hypothetical protein